MSAVPAQSNSEALVTPFERHQYEDPFLDMAATRLPKSMRKLQELCQIFAMTHPQIAPVIWRLAEYPITSITYTGDKEACRQHKDVLESEIGILDRAIEWGLDFFAYGNAFITVQFPFTRFYACRACKNTFPAKKMRGRKFDGREFTAMCATCNTIEKFDPIDQYLRRAKDVNVIRLEPMLITIKFNPVTGKNFYYYDIPLPMKQAVSRADWDIIDSTPVSFLKCIINGTKMRVNRIFHFKRPTLSGRDMQWGLPLILPVLKDAYLNQIYKKADEQIALEHSVPLRIMFPEPGTQDPLARIALGSFRGFMEQNIRYWRRDKNAILTAPLPVGVKVIGGDQNTYNTVQARQFVVDEIIGGLGVTKGFVMGNEQWSAGSISQRILENSFLNYLRRLDQCLQWVDDEISNFLRLPKVGVAMKPFRKIDDIQSLQLVLQMAREKRVSWNEVLSRFDLNSEEQLKQIEREAAGYLKVMIQELMGQAEAGAKTAVINAVAQNEAQGAQSALQQQAQGEQNEVAQLAGASQQKQLGAGGATVTPATAGGPPGGGGGGAQAQQPGNVSGKLALGPQIDNWARDLLGMKPDEMMATLKNMAKESPELGSAITERASQIQKEQQAAGGVDIQQLLTSSKNPDDVAQKMMLLNPNQRMQALRAIQSQNPVLGLSLMKALSQAHQQLAGIAPATGGSGSGANPVDMRPLPEQKPPRRTNRAA